MAQNIPIAAEANQELSVTLDGLRFVLTIKEAAGVMVADVTIDGATVLRGTRLVAGTPVIPYAYLESGNFVLITDNDELPDWRQFGVTQSLVYLSAAEIAAL